MKNLLAIHITFSLIFISGCSDKKKDTASNGTNIQNRIEKKLPQNRQLTKSTEFDPCDCNKRSHKILDKTIAFRLQFESIKELKTDLVSKKQIKDFAIEYIELTRKCFEINHAQLLVDSECNNLKKLEMKKDSLNALGVPIQQGAAIKL